MYTLQTETDENIALAIDSAIEYFSKIDGIDIARMQGQIKLTKQILSDFKSGKTTSIIEAPTGFGKSILAMLISKVFANLQQSSYILTSQKFLQDQYDSDFKRFNLESDYILLKGQSNYICNDNNESFTRRTCLGVSLTSVVDDDDFSKCAATCQYIQRRLSAMRSQTAVFNYSYWLTSMNFVYAKLKDFAPFTPRTLTIFDESHLIGDVVQGMFGQSINIDRTARYLRNYSQMLGFVIADVPTIETEINSFLDAAWELDLISNETDYDKIYSSIVKFVKALSDISTKLEKTISKLKDIKDLSDDQKKIVNYFENLDSTVSAFSSLLNLYDSIGHDSIVLSALQAKSDESKNAELVLQFQCTDEREIIKKHVLEYSQYSIFMSATIGNIDVYAENCGITNYSAIYVESDFDFTKSPIYQITPILKMTYAEKTMNMPKLIQNIQSVLDFHANDRGLIHTGTFEFMTALKKLNNNRLLFYNTADEKSLALAKLAIMPNAVICGPSILEGVDLKDDLSRFQIFMKVPYASLADKLTKRKIEKYPSWYDWITLIQVLQGIGRSVRHKSDYAATYLMDGSFQWFMQKQKLSASIRKRMKTININSLGSNLDADFDDLF